MQIPFILTMRIYILFLRSIDRYQALLASSNKLAIRSENYLYYNF